MTKILYIGNQLLPGGGSPTAADLLPPLLRKEGYDVRRASSKKNKLLRLLDMLILVSRNARSADYVVIDTYSTQNFWYAYSIARLCQRLGLKYIPVLHGGNLPGRLNNSSKACNSIFTRAFVNISPSPYLKVLFEKEGYPNIKYIPNSIPLDQYQFRQRKKLRPRLLWVRAFAEIYNPMLAISSLEIVLEDIPEAELCMVGPDKDGTLEACQQYVKQKNLPVEFTGKISKDDLISLAADYDVFLNTTNIDNTPVSVIEAMALGLPIVSTDVGGVPYLVCHDLEGSLVSPNRPEEMAQEIIKMLENPDKAQEMALSARRKVENFDWEVVKQEWKELLR